MKDNKLSATLADRWGYPLRTSSGDCVAAIDAYYDQVLSYGRNRAVILEAPINDPACVIGNALAAHFMGSQDLHKVFSLLSAAAAALVSFTLQLVKDYPKNLVSLKRALLLCFCMGQPQLSLNLVELVLPQNPDQNFIYGLLAFPLLELGRMAEAETASRRGLEINRSDCWSQHCYNCRFKEAVEFMESCSSTWSSCSSFMYTHNWWHVAVCYLEGNAPQGKVLEVYDEKIWKELQSDFDQAEVFVNALGLLLRFDVRGQMNAVKGRVFLAAETLKDKLAEAMYAYGRDDHCKVIDILGPDFDAVDYKMIGASDEQLEVFNEIWYNVLINTGHAFEAIELIKTQLKKREGCPYLWHLLEKAYVIGGVGDANMAAEKAKALEISYFN
ncbi:hypothetical protein KSP40_PGU007586 [Platanthera guangdongensis]|uniref:Tetratricopeptide repeat protein 38 n=1 Tax=Platanthera guangdongensis TaxID=2320717 RepID=A0ABR2MHV5_9ASPA